MNEILGDLKAILADPKVRIAGIALLTAIAASVSVVCGVPSV